jgi:hypothetical protein
MSSFTIAKKFFWGVKYQQQFHPKRYLESDVNNLTIKLRGVNHEKLLKIAVTMNF